MNTYTDDIEELLIKSGCDNDFYSTHKPVKEPGELKPLTAKERKQVERVSTERGYRRFTAEMMGGV